MSDKSRFRRGDFEARQRQLPADKKVRQAKGYAREKARLDQENTPLGSPPKPVDVRSVYDTRPINAFDFNIARSAATDTTLTSVTLLMSVPEGFIAVLRNFDLWFEPNPPGVSKSNFRWSLQLNRGDYPYNLNVPFGVAVDRESVFMIANEFNTIGLRITTTTSFVVGNVRARFYGNFLLKSGLPAALEVGNLVPKSSIPPKKSSTFVPPPKEPPPSAPPPSPPAGRQISQQEALQRLRIQAPARPLYSTSKNKK